MSMFPAKSPTTVRPSLPRLLSIKVCLAVFCVVGLTALGLKYRHWSAEQPAAPPQVTAKICIHHPTFAFRPVWQEILAQSRSEVRDHLNMEGRRCGETTAVSISLSDLPRETIAPLVNMVASAYAQACRTQWKVDAERACSAAQEKLNEAQRLVQEADARLESLRQRQNEALAGTSGPSALQSPVVDNPQWSDAARRLTELEERRRVLLFDRTPLHPSVQELEMRISDVRREMASIPAKIAQASSAGAPPAGTNLPARPFLGPTSGELETARQAAQSLRDRLLHAEAASRAALAVRMEELRIDLEPGEDLAPLSRLPRFAPAMWATALVTATTSVIGLGMIFFGASLEPTLSSIGELQAVLPVPIVGVVPAVHPGRRSPRSALVRRLARYATMVLGAMLLAVVAWQFVGG
jgi:hypothetical protein